MACEGLEPTYPEGTWFTVRRAHQLLNCPILFLFTSILYLFYFLLYTLFFDSEFWITHQINFSRFVEWAKIGMLPFISSKYENDNPSLAIIPKTMKIKFWSSSSHDETCGGFVRRTRSPGKIIEDNRQGYFRYYMVSFWYFQQTFSNRLMLFQC